MCCLSQRFAYISYYYSWSVIFPAPSHPLGTDYKIKSAAGLGKIEIDFNKLESSVKWTRLGEFLSEHNTISLKSTATSFNMDCQIISIDQLTHDTKLYAVGLPQGYRMLVPIGHHVSITAALEGIINTSPCCPIIFKDSYSQCIVS